MNWIRHPRIHDDSISRIYLTKNHPFTFIKITKYIKAHVYTILFFHELISVKFMDENIFSNPGGENK